MSALSPRPYWPGWANWQVCEAYKRSGTSGVSHLTDLGHFRDPKFGVLWIEANSIEDLDARSFALESLVTMYCHRDAIELNIHNNHQLSELTVESLESAIERYKSW